MAGNVSGAPAIPGRLQQGLFLTKLMHRGEGRRADGSQPCIPARLAARSARLRPRRAAPRPRAPGSSTRASPRSQAYEIPCQTAKRGAFADGLPGNGREMESAAAAPPDV